MRVLILDLDGVLVGSKDVYAEVVREVLARRGHAVDAGSVLGARVPHVPRWVGALVEDGVERLALEVRFEMIARTASLPVRESARDVLEALAADHLFLVTNATSSFAGAVLGRMGIRDLFERVVTSDDGLGPKENAISLIARDLDVDPRSVIYVGDTRGDVAAARRAGCLSVVLYTPWSWDHGSREAIEAERPDAIAGRFEDLPAVVETLGSRIPGLAP